MLLLENMDLNSNYNLNLVKDYITQISNISDADWNYFSSRLVERRFPKKTTFLRLGEIEDYISFIIKGTVRLVIPNTEPDKEITLGFSFEEQFVSAYDSFLTRTPSTYQLETLSDTQLMSISYKDLQDVYQSTDIGNFIGRLTAERLFLIKSRREQTLLKNTAKERYLNMFRERPSVIKEIPLKYISSYIGVTPQALSRIRRNIN